MPKNSSKPWAVGRYLFPVAEVVLAELAVGVARGESSSRQWCVLGLQANIQARRMPTLVQAGAVEGSASEKHWRGLQCNSAGRGSVKRIPSLAMRSMLGVR